MKPVTTKWQTDGQLAVLYLVGKVLAFYSTDKDPHFKKGQKISFDEFRSSEPYKAIEYSDEALPSDCSVDLNFAWSKE